MTPDCSLREQDLLNFQSSHAHDFQIVAEMLAASFNFDCSIYTTPNIAIVGIMRHQLLSDDPSESRPPS